MRDALIALGMGGPESVETIRPFLYNLFCDREIIDFRIGKMQSFIAKRIASKRAKKIAPQYLKMGYGGASPQNVHTRALLKKLPSLYKEKTGRDLETFPAMCYFHPYIHEAVTAIFNQRFDRIFVLPLYPQYSMTTTGACYSKLNREFNKFAPRASSIIAIPDWYKNDVYCQCIVDRIKESAERLGKDLKDCCIVFSAHSIPVQFITRGDPYVRKIEYHAKLIAEKANLNRYEISYQSKIGPVKWVTPSTINKLAELKNSNVDNIIVVPIAFTSDHIETLIELDEELIPPLKKAGMNIIRSRSLNSDDDFAVALIDVITGAI